MNADAIAARFAAVAAQVRAAAEAPASQITFGPWLNTDSAALYLDFPSINAFRKWARKAGVVGVRRGRRLLFAKHDLDAALKLQPRSAA